MHPLIGYPFLILWVSALVSFRAVGAETEGAKVDLDKTRELFQSWSERKGFPDSAPLAYYNAYSLQALQGVDFGRNPHPPGRFRETLPARGGRVCLQPQIPRRAQHHLHLLRAKDPRAAEGAGKHRPGEGPRVCAGPDAR